VSPLPVAIAKLGALSPSSTMSRLLPSIVTRTRSFAEKIADLKAGS
jgi:hypothetical protein